MTAKEELSGLIDAFSEEEAQSWLARICAELEAPRSDGGSPATALALLHKWRSEPRDDYPDDWEELRRALDEDRPSSRSLFK